MRFGSVISYILVLNLLLGAVVLAKNYTFPKDFILGVSTASYQIEGAWNKDGKGENIWDTLTHQRPYLVLDKSSGDIACDSYHKYKEDVKLIVDLGLDFYRFSISWTRIFPYGFAYKYNKMGIDYYNKLIDELLANNIEPMVTIYHWDLPQTLQELGGWTNPIMIRYFTEYSRVLFDNFGDRVKYWITINEPSQICNEGYGVMDKAPALNLSGIADYLCGHNLLKSHAAVYHLYDKVYRPMYNGSIGFSINAVWYQANATEDEEAAERIMQMYYGWFANPIYSKGGDYPEIMKKTVEEKSKAQGYRKSRLPEFTQEEVESIKGTADFMGMNYYTTKLVKESSSNSLELSYANDIHVDSWFDDSWPTTIAPWFRVYPPGFRRHLKWIRERYDNPEIYITENGYPDGGDMNDYARVEYLQSHFNAILEAIYEDDVKVKGYSLWSLLDNFEWLFGYEHRFGLYYVNFTNPERPRIAKKSAIYYKDVIRTRKVLEFDKLP